MPYARSTDCNLYWTSIGSGPPLILIRGLGRSHRYFEPILPALARRFQVILMDNRGAGRSESPPGPYTSAQMADDVVAVLDAAGVSSAWLLGMSLGGMIALDVVQRHPERVRGLILGSVTARGSGVPVAVPMWPKLLLAISVLLPKRWARRVQAYVTLSDAFVDQADAVMDRWDAIAADEPFSIRSLWAHLAAIRSHDSVPFLSAIDVPTLVLAGRDDRLVPWRNGVYVADRIPGAELLVLDDCGHNIETERPAWMARRVTEFVANRGWRTRAASPGRRLRESQG